MQKIGVYSMYDKESKKYDTPFFAASDLMAKRKFIIAINSPETIVHNFKDDFELIKVGIFDTDSGSVLPVDDEGTTALVILKGNTIVHTDEVK